MNSPRASSSPSYRNLKCKHSQSPIELKEKMRKDYKDKIQKCRNMLMNKFRGPLAGDNLHQTLTKLYKDTFNFTEDFSVYEEDIEVLEEIKKELIQEELEWCLQEYEKCQTDNIDWSLYQVEDHVICPVCQKTDLKFNLGVVSCDKCKIVLKTQLSLSEIKNNIYESIERHGKKCNSDTQFSMIPDLDENHIYLMCDACLEMQLIV
ncbi:RPA-interacting protein-like [Zerene cesonia]|uniref:RPA-interacting protein-like n=1 Tax=Zerene cesonia TaxID=33412 RepID=UPI0018E54D05|nr:RPA-interacting protein-like [Zerene cesonia]